jgi:hypothetical protein
MVPGLGADAEALGALHPAAGEPSGDDWIGQKQDKSGERKAADQDRPVPDIEAKNSTLRRGRDDLGHGKPRRNETGHSREALVVKCRASTHPRCAKSVSRDGSR